MKEFKTELKDENGVAKLSLSGDLNEHSRIPVIKSAVIHVDLEKISAVNSYGIRAWMGWIGNHSTVNKIVLSNCPYSFIKSASTIQNFIPSNTEVMSFYVPYANDDGNDSKDVLFVKNIDFEIDGTVRFPKIQGKSGEVLEPDVDVKNYFSFLKIKK